MEFEETPFGTHIKGLKETMNKIGEIGQLELDNSRLAAELEACKRQLGLEQASVNELSLHSQELAIELEACKGELTTMRAERDKFESALKIVAYPIKHLQLKADEDGGKLDGILANRLANSASWLRGVAAQTLAGGTDETEASRK